MELLEASAGTCEMWMCKEEILKSGTAPMGHEHFAFSALNLYDA